VPSSFKSPIAVRFSDDNAVLVGLIPLGNSFIFYRQFMISGYILVVAVLLLGGIIAVSGDRIGTKVGKARLTLFKLRPKQTATLVTIIVGTLLSASVLTVLFASSEQLRTGIFDLQRLQSKLRQTSEELAKAITQKNNFQQELEKLRIEQSEAKDALTGINRSVKDELVRRSTTTQQLKNLRQQLEGISIQKAQFEKEVDDSNRQISDLFTQQQVLRKQKTAISREIGQLNIQLIALAGQVINMDGNEQQTPNPKMSQEIQRKRDRLRALTTQLNEKETALNKLEERRRQQVQKLEVQKAQLQEKDKQLQTIDQKIGENISQQRSLDQQLSQLESQLKDRERKMAFIDQEVGKLEQEYQQFRQGNVAILRNQVMAFDVVRVTPDRSANEIVARLLKQANQAALAATRPDNNDKNLQLARMDADREKQIIDQIKNGKEYVVRLFAVSNYLVGEKNVELFADAALNQKVFRSGEVISSSSADPTKMDGNQLRQQLDLLLSSSQFRARRGGILGDALEVGKNGDASNLIEFAEKIKTHGQSIDIKAVALRDIYTAGPLRIKLQALRKGTVLFEN
jgi:uncharacterized protein (DUF3084 family)